MPGQNNPDGVEVKNVERDTVAFTPYATIKDLFAVSVFFDPLRLAVFFIPNYLLDADNSNIANPLVTPAHVVPEWYLLPFYAILRAIPNKLVGVVALFAAIAMLAFLPWLDTLAGQVGEIPAGVQVFFWVFVVLLRRPRLSRLAGGLGRRATLVARILTVGYFGFFLVVMPLLGFIGEDQADPGLDRRRRAGEEAGRRPS